MAITAISTSDALTVKLWERKMFNVMENASYFMTRFAGENENNIVQVKTDLTKQKGDKITFGIVYDLTGTGIDETQTQEGNEEPLTSFDYSLTLREYSHAVKTNKMSQKRVVFDIPSTAIAKLQRWGSDKIDDELFSAIDTSPTKAFWGGDATSVATLEVADLLTPALISKAATWARTGGNDSQPVIQPVRIEGGEFYALVVHPDTLYDWKQNSVWTNAARDALQRAPDHPFFKQATMFWDNVVIHEHRRVAIFLTGGSGSDVPYSRNILLGQQAGLWAWGERPKIVQQTKDYERERGWSWQMVAKPGKPVFNSLDYGSVGVITSRTSISDA